MFDSGNSETREFRNVRFCFRVTVRGLVPNTKYKFVIVSENGVSQQAGTERSAAIVIQTEAASEYLHSHTHAYTYTRTRALTHLLAHALTHAHTHSHTSTHTYARTQSHTHTYTHVQSACISGGLCERGKCVIELTQRMSHHCSCWFGFWETSLFFLKILFCNL